MRPDPNVGAVRERAGRAGLGQRQVGGVSGRVAHDGAAWQECGRSRVRQVVGIVARTGRVRKRHCGRAAAARIGGGPDAFGSAAWGRAAAAPADFKQQRRPARFFQDCYGLVEPHADVHGIARQEGRAEVGRRHAGYFRRIRVYPNAAVRPLGCIRPARRGRQGQVRGVAGRVFHGRSVQDKGRRPGVCKPVGAVARPHRVGERQLGCAVAGRVRGAHPRAHLDIWQHGAAAIAVDRHRLGERDRHVHYAALPVQAGRRGGARGKHPRRHAVDGNVVPGRQRAGRARRGQGQACRVAGPVVQDAGQGRRPCVSQVGGMVARPHLVGKDKRPRAVARAVHGRAVRPAREQPERRQIPGALRVAAAKDRLVKVYRNRNPAARAVRARSRRRRDRDDRWRPCVDCNASQAAERSFRPRRRQHDVGARAGGSVRDCAAARHGARARIVKVVRMLARLHDIAERQRVGAAARVVRGRAARVEFQPQRRLDRYRTAKAHVDVDCAARAVPAIAACGGDSQGGNCRHHADQL